MTGSLLLVLGGRGSVAWGAVARHDARWRGVQWQGMVQKSMNGRTSIWQEMLENINILIFCKDKLSGECKCYKNLNLSKQVLEFIDRSIFSSSFDLSIFVQGKKHKLPPQSCRHDFSCFCIRLLLFLYLVGGECFIFFIY